MYETFGHKDLPVGKKPNKCTSQTEVTEIYATVPIVNLERTYSSLIAKQNLKI